MLRSVLGFLVLVAIVGACGEDSVPPGATGPVVSRAVDEPPGVNCPDGGTAVQSGIDADGDGLLGDAEVDTTIYVCRRDRVRLVPEPAGTNCAAGGTAVWVGDDVNGNDVLDESEIRDVVYLCEASHELLTRLVPDAPGAPCPEGAAIEVGHDLDDNGVLDDAEVLVTEYVCGEAIQGYMVIDTDADLARFQAVRAVVGDVIIRDTGLADVALPNLWFVGGSVSVARNTALESLHLPQLYRIAKGFSAVTNPVLAEIEAPQLRFVGDWFDVTHNDQLTALDLDLNEIRGSVTIQDNAALAQLDWDGVWLGGAIRIAENGALTTVALQASSPLDSVRVLENPQLTTLELAGVGVAHGVEVFGNATLATLQLHVGTIAGDLSIVNNSALTDLDCYGVLDQRGLYLVGGNLTITGSPISDFGVGFEYEGLHVSGNATLANLAVTTLRDDEKDLEWVGGDLMLRDNPLLTLVRTRAGGGVSVMQNPALEVAWFFYEGEPHASNVVVTNNALLEDFEAIYLQSVAGEVAIANNPLLASPGLSALQVADTVSITNNPTMPACRIQALFARVEADSETQSGNDDDGSCE